MQKKNEKGINKSVLHGDVERPVSGIGMVLWTVRLQERRQVCQVCMGDVRHEFSLHRYCHRHYGIVGNR